MNATEHFIALVIYPTTPPTQVGHADTLIRMSEDAIRRMPGFISGRVFLSEDGENVVTIVEWLNRESFAAFRRSDLGRAGVELFGELHPRAYWLVPHAQVTAA